MKGTNVLYVSSQLGHRSVDITLQRYAQWVHSDNRKPNETYAKPEVV
jgi:integrase